MVKIAKKIAVMLMEMAQLMRSDRVIKIKRKTFAGSSFSHFKLYTKLII